MMKIKGNNVCVELANSDQRDALLRSIQRIQSGKYRRRVKQQGATVTQRKESSKSDPFQAWRHARPIERKERDIVVKVEAKVNKELEDIVKGLAKKGEEVKARAPRPPRVRPDAINIPYPLAPGVGEEGPAPAPFAVSPKAEAEADPYVWFPTGRRETTKGEMKGSDFGAAKVGTGATGAKALALGTGLTKIKKEALRGSEITAMLRPIRGYLGTFAFDEVKDIPLSPTEDNSFVLNTDNRGQPGTHWVAVWSSPVSSASIELYDSLADLSPLKGVMALAPSSGKKLAHLISELRKITSRWGLGYRLKLKTNGVRDQRANSVTCGVFCCQFILDRARGKTWSQASGYASISEAEKRILPLVQQFKYL